MKVLIIGGGIGGLVAALELEKVGIEAHVFESVHEVRPLGVGINLLPHAVKNLFRLGLLETLMETGLETKELSYFNKYGQRIWREPRGRDAGYKVPQLSIHRGELQMILMNAARDRLGDRIQTGRHLDSFRQTSDGKVVARFIDRSTGTLVSEENGDVLIGADGIHSIVRQHFYPGEGPPKWNGVLFWRAATEVEPFLGGRAMIMAGHPKQKFVAYPMSQKHALRGTSLVNWIAELWFDPFGGFDREDWNRRGNIKDFLSSFRSWNFDWLDIPRLIERTSDVYEFPCVDRDPLPRWTFGRATLLGDAAHPMYPMGSNGSSQAILDGRALAEALSTHSRIEDGLSSYEQARRLATERIVLSNRQSGPEKVMGIVEDRSPEGFTDLETVISHRELQEIADQYKVMTGSDPKTVNAELENA
jgi:2-polyprenyl-6-methoxyphenol hydroxylase-like FAD-dependent oxidoreductase